MLMIRLKKNKKQTADRRPGEMTGRQQNPQLVAWSTTLLQR